MWNKIEEKKPDNGQLCVVKDVEGFVFLAWYVPARVGDWQHGNWKFQQCPCCGGIGEIVSWMEVPDAAERNYP